MCDQLQEQKKKQAQQQAAARQQEGAQAPVLQWRHGTVQAGARRMNALAQRTAAVQTQQNQQVQAQLQEQTQQHQRAQVPEDPIVGAYPVQLPPMQAKDSRSTLKAMRERRKKRKAVRAIYDKGDEHTYDMSIAIQQVREERDYFLKEEDPEENNRYRRVGTDPKPLKTFAEGYRMDKNHNPATKKDEDILKQNTQFVNAYLYYDPKQADKGAAVREQLRKPILDRITKQLLETKLTPEMLSSQYLYKHAHDVKLLTDRLTYFQNLLKENPLYFDSVPEQKRMLERMHPVWNAFCQAFIVKMGNLGIMFNDGALINTVNPDANGASYIEQYCQENVDFLMSQFTTSLEQMHIESAASAIAQVKKEACDSIGDQTPQEVELFGKLRADKRILGTFGKSYQKDQDGRPATQADREIYEKNHRDLDNYLYYNPKEKDGGAQERTRLRKPILDDIVDQMLKTELTPEMLSKDYLYEHAGEVRALINRLTCIENVQGENREYFDHLPPEKKTLLNKLHPIWNGFCDAFTAIMGNMGVNFDSGEVVTGDASAAYQALYSQKVVDSTMQTFMQSFDQFRSEKKEKGGA